MHVKQKSSTRESGSFPCIGFQEQASTTRLELCARRMISGFRPRTTSTLCVLSAEFGPVDTVTSLSMSHKLDTNAVNSRTGLTALHYAAMTDQVEIAKALVDLGS